MDVNDFQNLVAGGYKILPIERSAMGDILLAERRIKDPQSGEPVYETVWAIRRDDHLAYGRVVRNNAYQFKGGVYRMSAAHDRRAEAIADAKLNMRRKP